MQNTNIMASSHNSSVVGGGSGGLPSGYMNFASGANFASDVTKCNIK